MDYQDAKETLLLWLSGLHHGAALRDEAIQVVLAEVERLKRMEESHREQGLVPSEWLTRAEAAEARVKELEQGWHKRAEAAEGRAKELEADRIVVRPLRPESELLLRQRVERLRAELKQHVEDALVVVHENGRLRAALKQVVELGHDLTVSGIAASCGGCAACIAQTALPQPEAAPKTHYKCKGCDRSGPLDYVAYSFVIQPEAAPKEER